MTHTPTPEQPEALKYADQLERELAEESVVLFTSADKAPGWIRRLHARVQELEAAQAQRVPLSDEQIAGFNRYVVGTVHGRFARAKALVRMSEQYHGITQEQRDNDTEEQEWQ